MHGSRWRREETRPVGPVRAAQPGRLSPTLLTGLDDFHNPRMNAVSTVERLVEIVQRDNAQTRALRARNPWQSSRVGYTPAGGCLWAEASACTPLRNGRQVSCGVARSFPSRTARSHGCRCWTAVKDSSARCIGELRHRHCRRRFGWLRVGQPAERGSSDPSARARGRAL